MQFLKITTVKCSSPEKFSDHVSNVKRSAGMYRDKGWMADDFDTPLDEYDGVKVNYAKFQGVEDAKEGMKTMKVDLPAKN